MQHVRRPLKGLVALLLATAFAGCRQLSAAEPAPHAPVDFVRDVQPILARHCHACHGAKRQEGGLRLSAREAAFAGGDSGEKAIVPRDPAASRLVKAISGADPDIKMPPEGEGQPLDAAQIALVVRWVSEGANWPDNADAAPDRPDHWAWHKPRKAALPALRNTTWPRHPLDDFVLARLEAAGLAPAPEADRHTLVRRVHLDLVGLPPTPAEVDAFVADSLPGAYERMVDRALADPGYGERWARMWLDLARYADSKGYGSDPLRTIWRYRDWVIEAFNRNLPYDRFTIEQLAGDLLPQPSDDQILATAFHRNTMANDEGGTDDEEFRVAAVKDRIETTLQVWMGLTMGCAKCHSHKFDPLTQREYYQAYAFFNQTEDADRGDEQPKVRTPTRLLEQQIADRKAEIAALNARIATPPADLSGEIAQWEQSLRDSAAQWTVLQSTAATESAPLEKLADGSLRAAGANSPTIALRVEARADAPSITAFRLELLPDDNPPPQGAGRAAGLLAVQEFRVEAVRPPGPVQGRFVHVDIPGAKKILSLGEVQVLAGADNLARKGKATQSSTAYGGSADLAIDGQTDGDFDHKSVTHTAEQDNPWWELDLGSNVSLDRVVLWNRTDHALESRLQDFRVTVLDDQRKVVWRRALDQPPRPSVELELAGPTQLELTAPSADAARQDAPIDKAIDGDPASGWAIDDPGAMPHYAEFRTKGAVGPGALVFTLVSPRGASAIGRFRLSYTAAPQPPGALPQAIGALLATAPAKRSALQRATLTKYYWGQSAATAQLRANVGRLESQVADLEKQIPMTPIMRELAADKRRETRTMIKGNYLVPGDRVEPALPAAFHRLPAGAPANRLGLALWLMDQDNPLTARVAVNRLWAQLFGVGIVATEEDFGTQGLPPTHPELLDWLAVEFMAGGWDIKSILRQIVTSATYRQSSSPADDVLAKDPHNRLLARGPRFRLEAEMVRDSALALCGLLSRKQGGPSVYPPQPPGLWRAAFNGERTWATSSGEDRYRRGLYTYWRRTVPYPSMAAFDAPSREICTLRRISTNTPLQAFVTLNDPVYVEAAQGLARRIVAEGGATAAERAAFALRLALARPPQPQQVAELVSLYDQSLDHYRQDSQAAIALATEPLGPLPAGYDTSELAAWTVVANVILNLDGVLTKR